MNAGQVVTNRMVSEKGKTRTHRRDLHTAGIPLWTPDLAQIILKHQSPNTRRSFKRKNRGRVYVGWAAMF